MSEAPQLFSPRNLNEAIEFCERLAKTSFVPDIYKGKPGEILACLQYGAEIGIGPMQSLNSIAVINGRPSLWGDVMLALVQASGKLEWIKETETADSATCEVKRIGDKEARKVTFSQADAVKAGLANKQGPWQTSPRRMRQMRARGFALRDKFADVLKGIIAREEAQDIPVDTTATELPPDNLPNNERPDEVRLVTKKVVDEAIARHNLTLIPDAPNNTDTIGDGPEADLLLKHWTMKRDPTLPRRQISTLSPWLFEHFGVANLSELRHDQIAECEAKMEEASHENEQ